MGEVSFPRVVPAKKAAAKRSRIPTDRLIKRRDGKEICIGYLRSGIFMSGILFFILYV